MTKLKKYTSVYILYYQNNTTMSTLHDAKQLIIIFILLNLTTFTKCIFALKCNALDLNMSQMIMLGKNVDRNES